MSRLLLGWKAFSHPVQSKTGTRVIRCVKCNESAVEKKLALLHSRPFVTRKCRTRKWLTRFSFSGEQVGGTASRGWETAGSSGTQRGRLQGLPLRFRGWTGLLCRNGNPALGLQRQGNNMRIFVDKNRW